MGTRLAVHSRRSAREVVGRPRTRVTPDPVGAAADTPGSRTYRLLPVAASRSKSGLVARPAAPAATPGSTELPLRSLRLLRKVAVAEPTTSAEPAGQLRAGSVRSSMMAGAAARTMPILTAGRGVAVPRARTARARGELDRPLGAIAAVAATAGDCRPQAHRPPAPPAAMAAPRRTEPAAAAAAAAVARRAAMGRTARAAAAGAETVAPAAATAATVTSGPARTDPVGEAAAAARSCRRLAAPADFMAAAEVGAAMPRAVSLLAVAALRALSS